MQDLSYDADLGTLGMDSINCMEVIIALEEMFHIAFIEEELLLYNINSVNKLADIIEKKLAYAV